MFYSTLKIFRALPVDKDAVRDDQINKSAEAIHLFLFSFIFQNDSKRLQNRIYIELRSFSACSASWIPAHLAAYHCIICLETKTVCLAETL